MGNSRTEIAEELPEPAFLKTTIGKNKMAPEDTNYGEKNTNSLKTLIKG
ncbi:hypothetical protein [Pedobacter sp. KACC 23697]|uniref:Uncharacterized protein n=1 Tax=Pedobacter sp. KACC 23697 TaxID=3149230 RepID=A0AAU7KC38_9SPHI